MSHIKYIMFAILFSINLSLLFSSTAPRTRVKRTSSQTMQTSEQVSSTPAVPISAKITRKFAEQQTPIQIPKIKAPTSPFEAQQLEAAYKTLLEKYKDELIEITGIDTADKIMKLWDSRLEILKDLEKSAALSGITLDPLTKIDLEIKLKKSEDEISKLGWMNSLLENSVKKGYLSHRTLFDWEKSEPEISKEIAKPIETIEEETTPPTLRWQPILPKESAQTTRIVKPLSPIETARSGGSVEEVMMQTDDLEVLIKELSSNSKLASKFYKLYLNALKEFKDELLNIIKEDKMGTKQKQISFIPPKVLAEQQKKDSYWLDELIHEHPSNLKIKALSDAFYVLNDKNVKAALEHAGEKLPQSFEERLEALP